MRYVALLRGINVGGNNLIKMSDLKELFEKNGFIGVATYINSGNVIFSSDESNREKLTESIEKLLSKAFAYKARVVIRSYKQMKQIIKDAPEEWEDQKTFRCYVGFLTNFVVNEDIKAIPVREGVDMLKVSSGVLYMTTYMSQRTKSGFAKMMGTKVYKEMTTRNFNTTKKVLALMKR